MRGLTLRVTNVSPAGQVIPDLPGQPVLPPRQTREFLYTDDVQNSLEYGSLNALRIANLVTFEFVSGTDLSQWPIGRTFTGATPTSVGVRGLVPTTKVQERGHYLRGDGKWSPITAGTVGAVPEGKLTQQGDLLVRGVTTSERLPLGPLGSTFRAGVEIPEWQDLSLAGPIANRPPAGPYYKNALYWSTDTNTLYVCHYNGSVYVWATVGNGGGGGWDTFPTGGVPGFLDDITHPGRAAVGVPSWSSIDLGIQFQVQGSTKTTRIFVEESLLEPDQSGATQIRGVSTDRGLYVKPWGYSERRVDLPGLTRKRIPDPEQIIIPSGSQYMAHGSITLDGSSSISLVGDSDLVILGGGSVPWTQVIPPTSIQTTDGSWTTILTLNTVPNKGHGLDLFISATRDDRGDQVVWKVIAAVTRDGAGIVTVRSVLATPSGSTPWDVSVGVSGTDIRVSVQGAPFTNIDWVISGSMVV